MNVPRSQACTWCKRWLSVKVHFSKTKQRRCDSCQHINQCCGCSCHVCVREHHGGFHTAECWSRFIAEFEARPDAHKAYPLARTQEVQN